MRAKKKVYRPQTRKAVNLEIREVNQKNGEQSTVVYTRYKSTWGRMITIRGPLGTICLRRG